MGSRYLDQFFDPALDTGESTLEEIAAAERQRTLDLHAVAISAHEIPRRLSDASGDELALDKKRSRRVAHVFEKCAQAWQGTPGEPELEQRQRGAQIDWEAWWADHEPWLIGRIRFVATCAKRSGRVAEGKGLVVRLNNELEWLRYAMR